MVAQLVERKAELKGVHLVDALVDYLVEQRESWMVDQLGETSAVEMVVELVVERVDHSAERKVVKMVE
jgi:hypothetical protein